MRLNRHATIKSAATFLVLNHVAHRASHAQVLRKVMCSFKLRDGFFARLSKLAVALVPLLVVADGHGRLTIWIAGCRGVAGLRWDCSCGSLSVGLLSD